MATNPTMTYGAAGNALASQSLAAAGVVTFDVDASGKIEAQVTTKATLGTPVAATRGVRIEAFLGFGSGTIQYASVPSASRAFASATPANGVASAPLNLPTGKWRIRLTNLDAANAVNVEGTLATVDGMG